MPGQDNAQKLRKYAQDAYEHGRPHEAEQLICECLRIDGGAARSLELHGMILYALGEYAHSVRQLETATLLVPLKVTARVCLAHAYGRIGRLRLSGELLAAMIDDDDIAPHLLLQIAVGLDFANRPDLAASACEKATQLTPKVAQAWYDLGYYLGRSGGDDTAVERLARKAVGMSPDNVRYRVGLAGLLVKSQRFPEAYELVKEFSKADIESISCSCCLQRIVSLYEKARDYRRVIIARQQIVILSSRPTGSSGC